MMTDRATIPVELAQAILNYLGTQPYANVYKMIAELQRAEPVVDGTVPKLKTVENE